MSAMDLVWRFLIGGAVVSVFAVIGELFQPKTFSGLFGAAPSVAVGSLALTYASDGPHDTAVAALWMAVGAIAMLVYAIACVMLVRREGVPVWASASAAWTVWIASALVAWWALHDVLPT